MQHTCARPGVLTSAENPNGPGLWQSERRGWWVTRKETAGDETWQETQGTRSEFPHQYGLSYLPALISSSCAPDRVRVFTLYGALTCYRQLPDSTEFLWRRDLGRPPGSFIASRLASWAPFRNQVLCLKRLLGYKPSVLFSNQGWNESLNIHFVPK